MLVRQKRERGISSDGRTLLLQSKGRQFDSAMLHQINTKANSAIGRAVLPIIIRLQVRILLSLDLLSPNGRAFHC